MIRGTTLMLGMMALTLALAAPACSDDESPSGADPLLCGNGVLDPGEACDGAELGGGQCEDFDLRSGVLACTDSCTVSTEGCVDPCEGGVGTDDGLCLHLSADGAVTGLAINGRQLVTAAGGGFVVTEYGLHEGTVNLLPNPGFEDDDGWTVFDQSGTGSHQWDGSTSHGGARSLRLWTRRDAGSVEDGVRLLSRSVPVEGGTSYYLSAFVKTSNGVLDPRWDHGSIDAKPDDRVNLGVDVLWRRDGELVGQQEALIPVFTSHSWKQLTRMVEAPAEADAVEVSCKLYGHVQNAAVDQELSLWLDDLRFFERPAAEAPQTVRGTVSPTAGGLTVDGATSGDRQLVVTADITAADGHLRVSGEVVDGTGEPRALDVGLVLPVELDGWTWWNDMREGTIVDGPGPWAHTLTADRTAELPLNWYPLSCLSDSQSGLALGVPVDVPRIFRGEYDGASSEFRLVFSLGLSSVVTAFPSRASFEGLLYQFAPQWGFRAAWQRYMEILPDAFAVRRAHGELIQAMGTVAPKGTPPIANPSDFGFRFVQSSGLEGETMAAEVYEQAAAQGYRVGYYTLPWATESGCAPSADPPPDYLAVLSCQEDKWSVPGTPGELARSMARALVADTNGDTIVSELGVLSAHQGHWSSKLPPNEDPDLPGGPAETLLGFVDEACRIADALERELHTIQMDNFFAESVFLDSDPSHHAYADIPLTFSPNTFEPAQHVAFSNVEYLRALAAYLEAAHPETAMTANALAKGPAMFGFPFLAALPFEMGTPHFNSAEPEWNFRRAMAGPRPVVPIEANVAILTQGTPAEVEAFCDDFMHRSLAYGFYPGLHKFMTAVDEADFDQLVEMLRPKYVQMIPVLDVLAVAGWRPTTHGLETSAPEVVAVERFGDDAAVGLYFTVHNRSDEVASYALEVDTAALGLEGERSVEELMSGEAVDAVLTADRLSWTGTLPPRRTQVLRVR